ncbi:MAG: FAD-dependent oxidoreductase [Caldilineaceae bacterium]|nr:FAD-dependent oxidoreductase [Caldilineaceae bacterium]MBP8106251.1 FAD-dependent oxidoreductase [Caldilineaceae bacterium]MBP8121182.1 FAD-dependent oxidoreductase [Caldilineaceae bacterium]MBP9071575.1 FAD-dependent oxidoreductase [Caldilineaceae bacterium]
MSVLGTTENPLRVAIVGAGPSGFYATDHLLKQTDVVVKVDLFDRLPTPYGLVRNGVAPDHQKIKSVTKLFDRVAQNDNFRFFGYVELGTDVTVEELRTYYHAIMYTTGAQTDRRMEIPGEDLAGSYPATEFVAWYNGHPDYRDYEFDLTQERATIIGVGNVAVDVARILCRTRDELMQTDIADYALEALSTSNIKEVFLMGRRGPAQAAFTTPEVKELGEMQGCDVFVLPEEVELDDLSKKSLAEGSDRATNRKVEIIQSYAGNQPTGKEKSLTLRFLVSPTELFGDEEGKVVGMRIVRNKLVATDAGSLRPKATDHFEEMPMGLVFRSIGYRGVPLPGVPFRESWGVIWNRDGRVLDPETDQVLPGEYTAGWIKRGPSGVIGTNKPDAVESVNHILDDMRADALLSPAHPQPDAIAALVTERKPDFFSYADWTKLDALELANGKAAGRPRVKFTSIEEMKAALGR